MITRHHVQGAAWMLWTFATGMGWWWGTHIPSSEDWTKALAVIIVTSTISWIVTHLTIVVIWLVTRPEPTIPASTEGEGG